MFNLHTHRYTNSPEVVELVNEYPWAFEGKSPVYSIGIHPWYIDEKKWPEHLDIVAQHLTEKGCWALGECGLDKRIEVPFDLQCDVFKAHLVLAEQHQKPVVLHLVGAFQELLSIKKQLNISVPLIVHGFSKSAQLAQELVRHGLYLSFGKYLLHNPDLRETFLTVPKDRFFLETDTLEESIAAVYAQAALYRNVEVNELQQQIQRNVAQVFGK